MTGFHRPGHKYNFLHASSVNRVAGSHFFSVTGYGLLASFPALITCIHIHSNLFIGDNLIVLDYFCS